MNKQYKEALNKLKVSDKFKEDAVQEMLKARSAAPKFSFQKAALIAASTIAAVALICFAASEIGHSGGLPSESDVEDIALGGNIESEAPAPVTDTSESIIHLPMQTVPTDEITSDPPCATAAPTEAPAVLPNKLLTENLIVNNPFPYKATDDRTAEEWGKIQKDYFLERMQEREDEAFKEALKNFSYSSAAFILQDKSSRNEDGNICFSPISYYYALSMAACGAEGETQKELMNALMMSGMTIEEMAENSRRVYLNMNHEFPGNIGKLSNSVWLNSDMNPGFRESFSDRMKSKYYASVFYRKFDDEGTKLFNQWIKETTNGFLNYQGELYPDEAMHIVNTLYCKVAWQWPFLKKYNETLPFYRPDGSVKDCEFIVQPKQETYDYILGDDYEGYSRNTASGKMIFILPNEGVSAESIAGNLEKLKEVCAPYYENYKKRPYARLTVKLPKFDIESTFGLKGELASRGVKEAFNVHSADFSGICNAPLYIGDIVQSSRIRVDEQGAEASAITDITLGSGSSTEPEFIDVTLVFDRPFIFILEHDGYPAFMGIIESPTMK